jgi:RND family efflux transporter MFP subunit
MGIINKVIKKVSSFTKRLNWKAWVLIFILLVFIIKLPNIFPISSFNKDTSAEEVIEVKEQNIALTLEYLGVVKACELKKIGFKMSGVLEKLFVSEGQPINDGDSLAQLQTTDIVLSVEAAKNMRDNAKNAYDFSKDNYEKMKKLLEAGAISEQDSEKARVEMENLLASYNNAEIDYENKLNNLDDTTLQADIFGFVAEVLYEEGEVIPGGYPVVVIRGNDLEISIGLSQDDLQEVKIGTPAQIIANDVWLNGKVISIGQLPDPQTKTYQTRIEIEDTTIPIGMTVRVLLNIGEETGFYIPISTVKSDEQDFVYVIDEEMIAHKKIVELGRIKDAYVFVSGLAEGDKVVTEGSKRLYDKDKVFVQ